jgi:chitosanase
MNRENSPSETNDRVTRLRRGIAGASLLLLLMLSGSACSPEQSKQAGPNDSRPTTNTPVPYRSIPAPSASDLSDPAKRRIADKVISTNENSTLQIQYCYVENLGDDRGIHAGKRGYTTRDGDALEVIKSYSKGNPGNPLAAYIPALEKVEGTDSTEGLKGYSKAWESVCNDPEFRKAQDDEDDRLYFDPAMRWANRLDIKTAAGQLALYDAMLMHGEGDDKDGFPALVSRTLARHPRQGLSEIRWLDAFETVRMQDLRRAYDPGTRKVWAEATDRVNELNNIMHTDPNLNLPLSWNVYGDYYHLP